MVEQQYHQQKKHYLIVDLDRLHMFEYVGEQLKLIVPFLSFFFVYVFIRGMVQFGSYSLASFFGIGARYLSKAV